MLPCNMRALINILPEPSPATYNFNQKYVQQKRGKKLRTAENFNFCHF